MAIVGSHQQAPVTIPVNATSPIDADEVRLNDNAIIANYNAHDNDGTLHLQSSSLGARPLPGTTGRLWLVTDTTQLYYDTGTAWVTVKLDASSILGGVVPIGVGGTGLTATPTDGQLLIGNGTGYTLATLTPGTNTNIVNTPGGIQINYTGGGTGTTSRTVTSQTATGGQTIFSVTYQPGYVDVFLNGVLLTPVTDYTATNGTTVVLASGAALNDELVFVSYTILSLASVINGSGTANSVLKFTGTSTAAPSQITDDGTTIGIRTVSYVFPTTQGASGTVLVNNGSGTLTWDMPANPESRVFARFTFR